MGVEHQPDMGVSKNGGTPKWMVKIMEKPIKMDDLGENPLFSETSIYIYICIYIYTSGQIIATSHDLTPNCGLVGKSPYFRVT